MEQSGSLRIGEVAHRVGIHPSTIRSFERRGLLTPPRDWAGQRRFTEADVQRLQELVGTAAKRPARAVRSGGVRRAGA